MRCSCICLEWQKRIIGKIKHRNGKKVYENSKEQIKEGRNEGINEGRNEGREIERGRELVSNFFCY